MITSHPGISGILSLLVMDIHLGTGTETCIIGIEGTQDRGNILEITHQEIIVGEVEVHREIIVVGVGVPLLETTGRPGIMQEVPHETSIEEVPRETSIEEVPRETTITQAVAG